MEQRAKADSESVVDVSKVHGRHRRPTGAPPPLPKKIGATGVLRLALLAVVVLPACVWLHANPAPLDRFDAEITDAVVSLRVGWLDTLARSLDTAGSRYGLAILMLLTIGSVAWFKRWRHLTIFLIGVALSGLLAEGLLLLASRPRPFDVTIIGTWEGYSAPSLPMGGLAVVIAGFVYMLVVPGRPRMYAKCVGPAVLLLVALLRIYLGIDHFTDTLFGILVGVSVPVALFRAFAPNDVYPVRYGHHGKSAHLDVSGRRGEAITLAMKEQLGYEVLSMKPVGLEGSGGSTPLKMRVVDDQGVERSIFAKLYAKNHVRADRWYKLGRTMLYGRLEDETPFSTVRRFVEYEDYTLRLLGEKGFSTPQPLDIVEITPEREYLIAMEFFEDSVEISEADVDDQIIDDGLQMVRKMWDNGLSHRDIKPANLMVQDGRLRLIDVFFVQVRPSPWRQAVDLGNMMLVLALRSDPELVYEKALAYFTPEELAEAFAATRGVASPSQLRASMKADGRGLLETFRRLAPSRKPIGIQRWSVRRVLLIVATVLLLFLCVLTGVALFIPSRGDVGNANCGTGRTMQLMAQAVPTATKLPCIDDLPLGWGTEQASVVQDRASFTVGIGSDLVSPVIVTLTETCAADPAVQAIPVDGGCVTYEVPPGTEPGSVPSFDAGGGLSLMDRGELVTAVKQDEDLVLCGALAPPCAPAPER
jgi:tRNA A-37 threonylcarbamoyl transferase component Bud32/membrane-associated phospholipid phosphatase